MSTIGTPEERKPKSFRTKGPSKIWLFFNVEDRNHTDSRRIEPNSRTFLTGEQPDPS